MAAPAYTTDLVTIASGSITNDTGTWDESSDAGWDTGGAMVDDANLYYNGGACVSAQLTKDATGTGAAGPATIMFVPTTLTYAVPTDGAILIHHLWAAPPALNLISGTPAGVHIIVGDDLGAFDAWNIGGSDFFPAPKGGWTTYAINPTLAPDDTVGGGTTPFGSFGMGVSATQQARGNPHAVNAIRVGRCKSIFTSGETSNEATFAGFAAVDSLSYTKWSLIDPAEGGYKYQGLMSFGTTDAPVDFLDSNVNITIADTIRVTTAFNAIEVHHIDTVVDWTAVNITALGTNSPGTFEMIDTATVNKTNCVFTDMGTFVYLSGATLTGTTYRRCDLITQGSGIFDSCTFDSSAHASGMVANNISLIDSCEFVSDGTGHAIVITEPGTYAFNANVFTGYSVSDNSPNSAIRNASGGLVTIGVTNGAAMSVSPTTGGSAVTVTADVPITIQVNDEAGNGVSGARVRIADLDNVEISAGTTDGDGEFADTTGTQVPVEIRVRLFGAAGSKSYIPFVGGGTIDGNGLTATIRLTEDIIAND